MGRKRITMPKKRKTDSSSSKAKVASSPKKKQKTSEKRKETKETIVKKEEEQVDINIEEGGEDSLDEMGAMMNSKVEKSDSPVQSTRNKKLTSSRKPKVENDKDDEDDNCSSAIFIEDPIPDDEAKQQWPHRYKVKGKHSLEAESKDVKGGNEEVILARRHYRKAKVDGSKIYNLYDDAHVQGEEGKPHYICQIVEMFEAEDGKAYFTAQWFYRSIDTDVKDAYSLDEKRVFFSEIRDDNPLDCLVEKLTIVRLPLQADSEAKIAKPPACDYYCDMRYLLPYSTFIPLPPDMLGGTSESVSTVSSDVDATVKSDCDEVCQTSNSHKLEATLVDLYSGCGAMSTGLCLGANLAGLNLVTRWAVDLNKYACESLKLNHPETDARNESVEDFLSLLKEWEKLCIRYSLISCNDPEKKQQYPFDVEDEDEEEDEADDAQDEEDSEIFEVEKILQICFGELNEGTRGLYFKVSWKNYDASYDSWEPMENLGNCRVAIGEFVKQGYKSRILPLPGDVDVICGGPPCQGISGFNRFRNRANPLADEKNKQLIVFMDVVKHLKPKFVLMENVVDLLKFAGGHLGRYALGRLLEMNYQARIGMMAAGAYGLPQYRMRVFLWGARANEQLPQYPYPTHDVMVRGVVPVEFERNVVAYDEGCTVELQRRLLLDDAISDLPEVENDESRDEMPYGTDPRNDFQRLIRSRKDDSSENLLYDHRPLKLNDDDYQRVCLIPKKKGANFRDLEGVIVRDNKSALDPDVPRVYLSSGKPLVPDYAITFVNGTSSKPFARLWWDETVPTVVTRAEPHNQAITHPEQDRVLTIRENARLQGFPDYYQLLGPIKERYIQVGNAVAVPVARALGYSLGMAFKKCAGDGPLFTLPRNFPNISDQLPTSSSDAEA